jgi:hypothetical protein
LRKIGGKVLLRKGLEQARRLFEQPEAKTEGHTICVA